MPPGGSTGISAHRLAVTGNSETDKPLCQWTDGAAAVCASGKTALRAADFWTKSAGDISEAWARRLCPCRGADVQDSGSDKQWAPNDRQRGSVLTRDIILMPVHRGGYHGPQLGQAASEYSRRGLACGHSADLDLQGYAHDHCIRPSCAAGPRRSRSSVGLAVSKSTGLVPVPAQTWSCRRRLE